MKFLRHPIRAIREPFGTAGLIVAMIALVAALGGTALAASKLNSTQKKEVEKIAKKFAGKPGASGAAGAGGPAGAAGKDGGAGTAGSTGAAGTSVTTKSFTGTKGTCKSGGVEVTSASPEVNVCNGTTGFTETLPSGKTLKGEWIISENVSAAELTVRSSVSYGIPLATAPTTHYIRPEEGEGEPHANLPAGCTGNVKAPAAEPGNLCVFAHTEVNSLKEFEFGPLHFFFPEICRSDTGECSQNQGSEGEGSLFGFGLTAHSEGAGNLADFGTWAVTAG